MEDLEPNYSLSLLLLRYVVSGDLVVEEPSLYNNNNNNNNSNNTYREN